MERMLLWDDRLQSRRKQAYPREDEKHSSAQDPEEIIDSFFGHKLDRLDPPQYSCRALMDFLRKAKWVNLTTNIPPTERNILVDDRKDVTDVRNWDTYSSYPPPGESQNVSLLNERELYLKLGEKVKSSLG
jgi:hypothetical protein